MARRAKPLFPLYELLAFLACGAGILALPKLGPALGPFAYSLFIAPTFAFLLYGFDRNRHRYRRMQFYKNLFARVWILGTLFVVGWVGTLEFLAQDPFLPIAICFTGGASGMLMGAGCIVYAKLRKSEPSSGAEGLPCPNCGYRIDNIPGPDCPECGQRFMPEPDNWTPKNMRDKPDGDP